MEILLSINPKYVKQILDGLKRVEFRKQSFKFKKNSRHPRGRKTPLAITTTDRVKTYSKR